MLHVIVVKVKEKLKSLLSISRYKHGEPLIIKETKYTHTQTNKILLSARNEDMSL